MAPFSMRYFVRNVMSVTVIGGISVSGFPLTFSTGGGGGQLVFAGGQMFYQVGKTILSAKQCALCLQTLNESPECTHSLPCSE